MPIGYLCRLPTRQGAEPSSAPSSHAAALPSSERTTTDAADGHRRRMRPTTAERIKRFDGDLTAADGVISLDAVTDTPSIKRPGPAVRELVALGVDASSE